MPFFHVEITEYEYNRISAVVTWPDLPEAESANCVVSNPEEFIVFVCQHQRRVIKETIARYVHQRFEALKNSKSPDAPAAAFLRSEQHKFFRQLEDQGKICKWVKKHESQLKAILPGEDKKPRWSEVILPLLEYSAKYYPGQSRENSIEKLRTYKTNSYASNNLR